MDYVVLAGTAVAITAGLAGVFVRRLPGVSLIWGAVLVWASIENTREAWAVVGVATVFALANYVVQHLLAGRPLEDLVAPMRNVAFAAALGIAGFLLARTLGLVAGFALGIYLTERRRLRRSPPPTRAAPPAARSLGAEGRELAVGHRPIITLARAIEFLAGLLVTAAWLVVVAG